MGAGLVAATAVRAVMPVPLPSAEDAVLGRPGRPQGVIRLVVPATPSGAACTPAIREAGASVASTDAVEAGREGVRADGVALPDALRTPSSAPAVRAPTVSTVRDGDVTPLPAQDVRAVHS